MHHRVRSTCLACLVVFVATAIAPRASFADSQGVWATYTFSGPVPPKREEHAAAYDPAGSMLMFGGTGFNDTWQLSLAGTPAWSKYTLAVSPPIVRGAMGAWDTARNRMVIYSGDVGVVGNTWAFSGTWIALAQFPAGRLLPAVVYDSKRDRLIVQGGLTASGGSSDVWALQFPGNTWSQLLPSGPTPEPRWGHAGIYDPVGDRLIIFSGRDVGNDVWELSLSGTPTWTQLSPSGTPPSSRGHAAVAYDPVRMRMLIHGGYENQTGVRLNDTRALNLAGPLAWERITPQGTPPPINSHRTMVYDEVNARLVLYGGFELPASPGQVWTLSFATYSLSVTTVGSGTVTRTPDQPAYDTGSAVALTAAAQPGWHFVAWGGDAFGSTNPLIVTMDRSKSITATFARDEHTLAIGVVGNGVVTKSPDQPTYLHGDTVSLAASPQAGWSFRHWEGDAGGSNPNTTVVMDADRSVTAVFGDLPPESRVVFPNGGEIMVVGSDYQVSWEATDNVEVTGVDIDVSRDGGATYTNIATNVPNTGSYTWQVDGPGANTTALPVFAARIRVTAIDGAANRTADESDSLFAIYDLVPHHTISLTQRGRGTIVLDPVLPLYEHGSTVTLTATPEAGWEFAGWEGFPEPANPLALAVDYNLFITGVFRDAVPPTASLIYPNGGQTFIVGSPYIVTWTAADEVSIAGVDLAVSRDSGATWEPIVTGAPNTGSYLWMVSGPGGNSGEAPRFTSLLSVTARDSGGNATTDQSDTPFAIHDLGALAVEGSSTLTVAETVSPNPTSGSTVITYSLPSDAAIHLSVYDLQGREVAVVEDGWKRAGSHHATWSPFAEGARTGAGVYFVRYRVGHETRVRRIVVTR